FFAQAGLQLLSLSAGVLDSINILLLNKKTQGLTGLFSFVEGNAVVAWVCAQGKPGASILDVVPIASMTDLPDRCDVVPSLRRRGRGGYQEHPSVSENDHI